MIASYRCKVAQTAGALRPAPPHPDTKGNLLHLNEMQGDVTKFQDLETQVGGIDRFEKTHKMSTLGLCWRKSQRTVCAVQRHVDKISFFLFRIYVRHVFLQNLKGDISFFLILRMAGQDNKGQSLPPFSSLTVDC